ncbi:FKBP-type peptidyl-prolyl cis-trans isomerase [Streptomyces sp. SPB074]|uniref:FKBP-type peptidyl-prolyl cis-trans isomerase n=1 Tax=Streptomyces sp. (strain SPB074) TaxID=465543 RepID=UPI00017F1092|nr:FKBP-type peptidyl-prolyl cis-trans isomerase [Streptomyces sp. SPB074]
MHRRLAALIIVPALALVATACGGDDDSKDKADSSSSPSASAPAGSKAPEPVSSASPMPTVSGAKDKQPTITIPKGEPTKKFVVHSESAGDGKTVKKGDFVSFDFTGKIWKGDKKFGSTYEKGGKPQVIKAGSTGIIPAFAQSLAGHKEGERVLVVAPPAAGFGAQGNQQAGVAPDDTLVFVVDINKIVPLSEVKGSQASIPSDLPQVKVDDKTHKADITIPKNDPPTKLTTKVLIQGKGEEIADGDNVIMDYSGAAWKLNEGKKPATLFDASANRGEPFVTPIGTGAVIPGWDKGLVGKHVGDRVLLVIPPADGYGDQAQGDTLPAKSTLVFAVDIVGAAK